MAEVLNLHLDGADASTTITDSATGKTPSSVAGNAQLTIAEKILGTAALKLDGNQDYILYGDSADWEVSTNDFEIRGWFKLNELGRTQGLFEIKATGNNSISILVDSGNQISVSAQVAGVNWGSPATLSSSVLTTGIWYYFKLKKVGTTVTLWLSSDRATLVSQGSMTISGSGPTGVFALIIGNTVNSGTLVPNDHSTNQEFNGWIDEIVFDNGATTSDVVPDVPDNGFFLVM